jgi:stage II sporulation protein R
MKTKIIAILCASFLLLNVVDMLIPRSEAKVYNSLIRLHVIADNDSDSAQEIKLMVRDAIISECNSIFTEGSDIVIAASTVEENLEQVEAVANRILSENGVSYKASVEWGREEYPTRVYEGFTLPSGSYLSLRVRLGKANGKNWWCILFPPLCSGVSAKYSLASSGISKNDSLVFSKQKYIFRFKLLELFGG